MGPSAPEQLPLIHGEKTSALGAPGLYGEVKAVLLAVANQVQDEAGALLLRLVSPH